MNERGQVLGMSADLVQAAHVTNELSLLLPRLTASFEAHHQAVKQLEADRAALASERAALAAERLALAEREREVAAREASCKFAEQENVQMLVGLKHQEAELASSKAEHAVRVSAPPPKKAAPMDSLSMHVLARATATALLKHGLQKQGQSIEAA